MKIFPTSLIAQIDSYTIENEPIADIDLMERASQMLFDYIVQSGLSGRVAIFCGPGNNGGDGLALARMLSYCNSVFTVNVYLFDFGRELSSNTSTNLTRLLSENKTPVFRISNTEELLSIEKSDVIIDALFGSGLNRPLEGLASEAVKKINESGAYVLSVDIPSGLMGEDNRNNSPDSIVRAHCTLTFQFPKISFLFPENECFVGKWEVLDIGLHQDGIQSIPSPFHFTDADDIKKLIKKRGKFSHKGTYGHALLIAGAYGKMGASILASKACLRSGSGLLTVHVPHGTYPIIQTAVPEAMCDIDDSDLMFTSISNMEPYSAIGVGPAIGQKVNAQRGLRRLIEEVSVPVVIDADAINILGLNPELIDKLPEESILTPHPKEFERIAGKSNNSCERMEMARQLAVSKKIVVVLKGGHTIIASPDGQVWFNSTGNPGMATAGSGDVLTGMILGLLSQHYRPVEAALIGVYIHGLAGDYAKNKHGENALIASDIIEQIGAAFKNFE